MKILDIFSWVPETEITLEEHMHIKLLVVGNEEMVDFYCLPTLDNQAAKVTVCSQQILIGNTAQCAVVFHNEPDGTVFGAILNNQNNWFLVYPDNFNGTPMYVNDKILKSKIKRLKTGDLHLDDFNSLAELNEEWEDYEEPKGSK